MNDNEGETSIKLAPSKLVAMGFPVILRVDSYGAFARAEQLEYDFAKQRISMRDREAVVLGNESYELKSKWLWYELRDGKQLGSMRAGGPGSVTGQLGKDQQRFEATWQTEVVLQPFSGSDVLSLIDAAHISIEGTGEVFADEMHVYLIEQPRLSRFGAIHDHGGSHESGWQCSLRLATHCGEHSRRTDLVRATGFRTWLVE